jgi:hypothetical protein
VLSSLPKPVARGTLTTDKQLDNNIKVFISYSHKDKKYLKNGSGSLLDYLLPLEKENFTFWCDLLLEAGDIWNEEIECQLAESDIALFLVSHFFLTSSYITEVEVKKLIRRRKQEGMIIIPVLLSSCDWESHDWLKETQFEPRGGETIEEHYTSSGKKKALYTSLYKRLRDVGKKLREERGTN